MSLAGRRVIVTREHPGELADLLAERGAEMVHVPLIGVGDPADGGSALRRELERLDTFDWLVVTSPEGARRVGTAAASTGARIAAVGLATAREFTATSGRRVDVVPETQRADALAAAIVDASSEVTGGLRVLVAQADLAAGEVSEVLRAAGHTVVEVIAYRTAVAESITAPDSASTGESIAAFVVDADAVLFASGSAVRGWISAIGRVTPPVVIAIGPSTAGVVSELGLDLTAVAADHSLEGLVNELEARFT
jgi:uroporphyrinogen-III synthase